MYKYANKHYNFNEKEIKELKNRFNYLEQEIIDLNMQRVSWY